MSIIRPLLARLRGERRVCIQPHNYPDHDAIATAFALQRLFAAHDIPSRIVFSGDVQRDSLLRMMRTLDIKATSAETVACPTRDNPIVVVDGCMGNRNVTDLAGEEIAVIDHHRVGTPENVPFVDIRSHYGACSSIVREYYRELDVPIPHEVATALLIGLSVDTALMTRGVSLADVETYSELYPAADTVLCSSILRNNNQIQDLAYYRFALENVQFFGNAAFCHFPEGCAQNLLGIVGDFFLALREMDFVVLSAQNDGKLHFSLRSESAQWDASIVVQDALEGIGSGGGHAAMAGGIVPEARNVNLDDIRNRFLNVLGIERA